MALSPRCASHVQQRTVLDMPGEHCHELRIKPRAPDRQRMTDDPQHQSRNPQLQAQPDRSGQRAVGNGDRARRAAQQDRFSQRAMKRYFKANRKLLGRAHTMAPPEKLKNDRKNEDAAKAMDRPKTIWTNLRKPPLVSPKASARPVAIMMITATMRATGPWMESRMDCNGPSQGMLEPAACAVPARSSIRAASSRPCFTGRVKRLSRARLGSGLVDSRKASTGVMAVLQSDGALR